MSDLVGNSENRFSHNEAQMIVSSLQTKKRGPTVDPDFDVYDRVFVNSLHSVSDQKFHF